MAASAVGLGNHGLSPRVRGNQTPRYPGRLPRRSIPACAGEPGQFHRPSCLSRVYPRVCGGTVLSAACQNGPEGLSPRVRGNLNTDLIHIIPKRSIPACAGEPCVGEVVYLAAGVYPRVCGGT